jgi:Protein of unknown function (DUF2752)
MNSVPPKIHAAGARVLGLVLAGTLLGIAAMVFFFNPATHNFYPVCQFHRLTGLNCPGCGMTRAFYALLHGNFSTALHDNALFVFALGILAIRGGWFGWNEFRGRANREFFPAKFLWPLLIFALVFTVLRNLPAFAFLSP